MQCTPFATSQGHKPQICFPSLLAHWSYYTSWDMEDSFHRTSSSSVELKEFDTCVCPLSNQQTRRRTACWLILVLFTLCYSFHLCTAESTWIPPKEDQYRYILSNLKIEDKVKERRSHLTGSGIKFHENPFLFSMVGGHAHISAATVTKSQKPQNKTHTVH